MEIDWDKTITFRQLKEYCEEYDNDNGSYPESKYEGLSVLSKIVSLADIATEWEFYHTFIYEEDENGYRV